MEHLNIKLGKLNLVNIINILKKKYENIMLSPKKINDEYYQNALSEFAYKKISKGPSVNIKPFDFQLDGFKKGRELKTLPKNIDYTHVYYFDNNNNLLLTEIYGESENIVNKEYYFYDENHIESIYFESGTNDVRNISFLINEKKQAKYWINYSEYGYGVSEYIYNNDKLTEINVKIRQHETNDCTCFTNFFEYNKGELVKITSKYSNGYEEQLYP